MTTEKTVNIRCGALTIGLSVLLVVVLAAAGVFGALYEPEGDEFTLILDDAGGITAGDKVTMNGRVIGKVKEADLIPQDGRMVVWVRVRVDHGIETPVIPYNSVASVSTGLRGRPFISIRSGDSVRALVDGDMIENTKSAPSKSMFDQFDGTLSSADAGLDVVDEMFADPKLKDELVEKLGQVESTLKSVEESLDSMQPNDDVADRVAALKTSIDETRKSVATVEFPTKDDIEPVDSGLSKFAESLKRLCDTLDSSASLVSDMKNQSDDASWKQLGTELRRQSASLSAMAGQSARNPARAGDGGRWQSRFNGGKDPLEPFGGQTKDQIKEDR